MGSLLLTPQLLKFGLGWAGRAPKLPHELAIPSAAPRGDIPRAIVVGIGPLGSEVASQLEIKGYDACLIDLSPINLHPFSQQGFRTIAGDGADEDVLRRADAAHGRLAVVTVPDDAQAGRIVAALRKLNPSCSIVVRCRFRASLSQLSRSGATAAISEEAEIARPLLALIQQCDRRG